MRHIIFMLGLLPFFFLAANAQPATTQTAFVGTCQFSGFTASGSNVVGTLANFSDQTNLYFANDIQVGDVAWDNLGTRWEIVAVTSSNLVQAVVEMRNINGTGGLPFGVGYVSRETPNIGLSMFPPDNAVGISPQLKSRVEGHNALLIDSVIHEFESVVGQSLGNNTIFISQAGGNDTTAIPGNIFKPYKTLNAGVAAAGSNALLVVFPGSYQWSGTTYTSGNFNMFTYPGVKIKQTGTQPLVNIFTSNVVINADQIHGDSIDRNSTLFFDQSSSPSTNLKRIDFTSNYVRAVRSSMSIWRWGIFSDNVQADTLNFSAKQVDFFGGNLMSIRKSKYINFNIGNASFVDGPIGGRFDEYFLIINPLSGDTLTNVDLALNVNTFRNISTDFEKHGILSIGNLNRVFIGLQANVSIGTYFSNSNRGTISHLSNRSLFSQAFNMNGSMHGSVINYDVKSIEKEHSISISNNARFVESKLNYTVNSAISKYRLFDLGQSDGDQADSIVNSVFNFFFENVVISDDCVINFNLANGVAMGNTINVKGNLSVTKPNTPVIYANQNLYLLGGCNLNVATSTYPAIESPVPITVYIDNAFVTNSTGIDPDVTYVNLGDKWQVNSFSATSGQSTYTVSTARLPQSGANLRVVVDGLERIEGAGEYYTYVPSTGVITFNAPLSAGQKVKISWFD